MHLVDITTNDYDGQNKTINEFPKLCSNHVQNAPCIGNINKCYVEFIYSIIQKFVDSYQTFGIRPVSNLFYVRNFYYLSYLYNAIENTST